VGGATLDNTNPRTPCVAFKNTRFAVPVVVTGVVVSGAGVEVSAGACGEDDNIIAFPATRICQAGTTLQPGGPGCYTGIRATGGAPAEYPAILGLALKARCTNSRGAPCSADELKASPPSPSRPVDVTWSDPGRKACVRVPEDPADNEFCNT
jgi:hypothetical protein